MSRKKDRAGPQQSGAEARSEGCEAAEGQSPAAATAPAHAAVTGPGQPAALAAVPQEQLQKQLDEARQNAQANIAILQRVAADFDNFKKFAERDKADAVIKERSSVLAGLIDIMENLERAVAAGAKELGAESGLMKGLRMTVEGMSSFLEANSVRPIVAVGQKFDPALHEAVCFVPAPGKPEYTVAEEFRRGYTINGRVLRTSKVSVVSRPEPPCTQEGAGQAGHDKGEREK